MYTFEQRKLRAEIVVDELKKLFPNSKTILKFSNNWELAVAVILSAQTTDAQVNVVTEKLFKKYPALDHYIQADPFEFENDVKSVNYFRNKAKYILAAARMLKDVFHGELPRTVQEMMMLPGVGRKTALVVLGNAYNIVEGIAVDTHVHRLSIGFGLTNQRTPKKIENDLKEIVPQEEWFHFTNRMIDYGRAYFPAHRTDNQDPISLKLAKRANGRYY